MAQGARRGGESAEGLLKRKNRVFHVFDMQATSCTVQQLRERERRSWTFETYLKATGRELGSKLGKREVGRRRFTSIERCLKQTASAKKKEGRRENKEGEEVRHNWLASLERREKNKEALQVACVWF